MQNEKEKRGPINFGVWGVMETSVPGLDSLLALNSLSRRGGIRSILHSLNPVTWLERETDREGQRQNLCFMICGEGILRRGTTKPLKT